MFIKRITILPHPTDRSGESRLNFPSYYQTQKLRPFQPYFFHIHKYMSHILKRYLKDLRPIPTPTHCWRLNSEISSLDYFSLNRTFGFESCEYSDELIMILPDSNRMQGKPVFVIRKTNNIFSWRDRNKHTQISLLCSKSC